MTNITPSERNSSKVAIPTAIFPIDFILAIGNSIPITNRSKITPISAKTCKISRLAIKLNGGVKGPMIIPANKYPIISGCRILKKARVTIDAKIMMMARSLMKSLLGRLKVPI